MASEPQPRCARHPRRRASGTCSRCGRAACRRCRRTLHGQALCAECAAEARASVGDAGPESRADPEGLPGGDAGEAAGAPLVPGDGPVGDSAPARELAGVPGDGAGEAAVPPPDAPVPRIESDPVEPGTPAERPPEAAGPPAVVSPRPRSVPPLLMALLVLQTLAALFAAVAAWRAWAIARGLERPAAPLAPVEAALARVPLVAPRLELAPGATLGPGPVTLAGEAPFGDVVALFVDDRAVASAVVADGRFALELRLAPGEHRIVAVAYGQPGAVAAPPVPVRAVARQGAAPAPEASPPAARATPAVTGESARRAPSRNIVRGPEAPAIALTFDGGSEANQADEVLRALRSRGVRSTIFLTGDFIRRYPDVVRRIVADGHEVGNHTLTHPHLADWVAGRGHVTRGGMTRDRLAAELDATARLFEETAGRPMSRWWRAPYGEVNREILGWAAALGWEHVGWTEGLDTLDWVADRSDRRYRTAGEIRDRLLRAASAGSARGGIVLMHLGGERTSDVPAAELPRIIDGLEAEGFRLVTVSALLEG